jgi:hypothetical protein
MPVPVASAEPSADKARPKRLRSLALGSLLAAIGVIASGLLVGRTREVALLVAVPLVGLLAATACRGFSGGIGVLLGSVTGAVVLFGAVALDRDLDPIILWWVISAILLFSLAPPSGYAVGRAVAWAMERRRPPGSGGGP